MGTKQAHAGRRVIGLTGASARTGARHASAALLALSLVVWSTLPTATHAPALLEALQNHAEMADEHDHGLADDLLWTLHGHGHEAADHDHSQAVLAAALGAGPAAPAAAAWRLGPDPRGPTRADRIERPPRA